MAIYFDENGNLVDTEISESSDVLPPNPFLSPGTTDDAYANLIGFPGTVDDRIANLKGVPETSNAGYLIGTSGTSDDVFPFEPPGTTDDNIANLISMPGVSDDVFPFAPKNRLQGLDLDRFKGVSDMSIIDETTNDEQSQEYIDAVNKNQESGIMKLLKFLIPGSMIGNFLPKENPKSANIKNFYGSQYGLTDIG